GQQHVLAEVEPAVGALHDLGEAAGAYLVLVLVAGARRAGADRAGDRAAGLRLLVAQLGRLAEQAAAEPVLEADRRVAQRQVVRAPRRHAGEETPAVRRGREA